MQFFFFLQLVVMIFISSLELRMIVKFIEDSLDFDCISSLLNL